MHMKSIRSSRRPSTFRFMESLEQRLFLDASYTLDPSTATPGGWAQEWSDLFRGNTGWTGADGVYAIPLNGIRKLGSAYETPGANAIIFSDTLIGTVDANDRRTGFRFINNSIGMYYGTGADPIPVSFKWKGDQSAPFDGSTASMVTTAIDGDIYWPNDGVIVPDGAGGQRLVQFALKIHPGASIAPVGVTELIQPITGGLEDGSNWPYKGSRGSAWYSTNDMAYGQLPNLFKADSDGTGPIGEISMGVGIIDTSTAERAYSADGYIYVYGVRADFLSKKLFVARATQADFYNPNTWTFWDAASGHWVANGAGTDYAINRATPMRDTSNAVMGGMSGEISVTQLPDNRFAMVYLKDDALGTKISVRYADAPQGPWSAPTTLYNVSLPKTGNPELNLPDISAYTDWGYVMYGAKAHAQFSKAPTGTGAANAGKMLLSFHINIWRTTSGNTSQPNPSFVLGSIYRPRFLSVDIVSAEQPTLPAGWAAQDIGSPALAGSSGQTGGQWTIKGAGVSSPANDQLQFASTDATGNVEMVALVNSITNTHPSAAAGVMMRNGAGSNAMFATVVQTAGNGVVFQWRTGVGGASSFARVAGIQNAWVKLVRSGNNFSGYYSLNGTTWIQISTAKAISMPATVKAGLAVTSQIANSLATATLSSVGITPALSPAPLAALFASAPIAETADEPDMLLPARVASLFAARRQVDRGLFSAEASLISADIRA
jgi:Domain of unknown function (DUF4185)